MNCKWNVLNFLLQFRMLFYQKTKRVEWKLRSKPQRNHTIVLYHPCSRFEIAGSKMLRRDRIARCRTMFNRSSSRKAPREQLKDDEVLVRKDFLSCKIAIIVNFSITKHADDDDDHSNFRMCVHSLETFEYPFTLMHNMLKSSHETIILLLRCSFIKIYTASISLPLESTHNMF